MIMKTKSWVILILTFVSAVVWSEIKCDGAEVAITGITEPILNVTLSSPVAGIVGKRLFKEGDFVKEGQVVVELDKRLEELEASRRKLIANKSKTDFEATRVLFTTTKSVSQEELDKKELEYKVADADYEIAAEQLRKRQIVSPLSGYITEFFREVGEAAQANERVVRIVDTRRCYFVGNLEASVGYALKADQTVKLEVEAGTTKVSCPGKISFVSPVVDPASGLLKVKVIFENTEGRIRPGVTGSMRFDTQTNAK